MNEAFSSSASRLDPQQVKSLLSEGLMSFPLTDFDAAGEFDAASYRARLEWLMPYGAAALFVAGGTGEGFSLTPAEHQQVVQSAVETCAGATPSSSSRRRRPRAGWGPRRTCGCSRR